MLSDSQKRANQKWDKENMKTVSCRLKVEDAEMFKAYCDEIGTTPTRYLKEHIIDVINKRYYLGKK